jgi:hypothetical protein
VVGMFDVLKHLDDATRALSQVRSILHDEGKLILTVPAHMWLWSPEDKIAEYKLRYSKSTIKDVLDASGFQINEIKYFFIFILP